MPVDSIVLCPECGTEQKSLEFKCKECGYCTHASMTDGKCDFCGMTEDEICDEAEYE